MKLLADIGGEPLVNRTLSSLIDAGVDPVVVVLSAAASLETVPLIGHANVRTVVNRDPSRGMFSSIQCGLSVATADAIVVLPADMPFVQRRHSLARCAHVPRDRPRRGAGLQRNGAVIPSASPAASATAC